MRILSVSTLLDTDNSARVGSIEGGTRLYIKMVGHDSTLASNNSIYIGSYPCEIPGNFLFINKTTSKHLINFWEFYIKESLILPTLSIILPYLIILLSLSQSSLSPTEINSILNLKENISYTEFNSRHLNHLGVGGGKRK